MDRIDFRWAQSRRHLEDVELHILINGNDLIGLLKSYEDGVTDQINIIGSYVGMGPHVFGENQSYYKAFLGSRAGGREMEKALLYVCGDCGFEGCWDMLARIEVQGGEVVWSEFEQPHRGPNSWEFWDYSGFGPFRFDKGQYMQSLKEAGRLAATL